MPLSYRQVLIPLVLGLSATTNNVLAVQQGHANHERRGDRPQSRLYDDLGEHGQAITTSSPQTQAYFNQGLRFQYAFNHAEAIRSYQTALETDSSCAMCWWGIALASGPNINSAMTDEDGRRAYQAVRMARERAANVTTMEAALINALAERYGPDPARDRAKLDSAYAKAMARVAAQSPDDDVLTLYGAALMNLNPWNYWDGDYGNRTPRSGTALILSTLERAIALDPNNPGACHYYIHAVEAAFPKKAEDCADRIAALMPGAGHIVHMPGHIYIRVGRYADAVRANEHAVHEDEELIADMGMRTSLYAGAYYPHNYHFMAFAATMAGMSEKALYAARMVAPRVPLDVANDVYWIQNAVVLPQLTLLTFGRWEEVLEEPLPPADLEQASILAQYARGVAYAALGQFDEARRVLRVIERAAAATVGEPAMNPVPHIAPLVLAGEIAMRSGDAAQAVREFRAAADIEDALLYDEPPLWYYPVRHSLGRALLEAGRPAEAERAYRKDLDRFPANGWSLFGLAQSLEAQDKAAEASEVRRRFRAAWASADVELVGSRY